MENANQSTSLQMAVIPQSILFELTEGIGEIKELLSNKTAEELNSQWIESGKARQMLGVSQKTWQTYRDKRIIPFSQFGRKIYVKMADLEAFMDKHYITSVS